MIRELSPMMANPSVTAGRTRYSSRSNRGPFPRPEVGSQPKVMLNSKISMMPSQKEGMDTPTSENAIRPLSTADPRLSAAIMPRGMETTITISMEARVSSSVAGNRLLISSKTGTREVSEIPKSPLSKLET